MNEIENLLNSGNLVLILSSALLIFIFLIFYFRETIKGGIDRITLNNGRRKFTETISSVEECSQEIKKILNAIVSSLDKTENGVESVLELKNKILGNLKFLEKVIVEELGKSKDKMKEISDSVLILRGEVPEIKIKIEELSDESKVSTERNAIIRQGIEKLSTQLDKFNDLLIKMHESLKLIMMRKIGF